MFTTVHNSSTKAQCNAITKCFTFNNTIKIRNLIQTYNNTLLIQVILRRYRRYECPTVFCMVDSSYLLVLLDIQKLEYRKSTYIFPYSSSFFFLYPGGSVYKHWCIFNWLKSCLIYSLHFVYLQNITTFCVFEKSSWLTIKYVG